MDVGFIGLGRMGRAIAARILDGGHTLTLYERTPGHCTELVAGGAHAAATIAETCAGREVVITMVSDDVALAEVALAEDGICVSLGAGAIHLAMGTYGVAMTALLAEAHAEAGQRLVGAPVLGRPAAAAEGQLGIIAAGEATAVAACGPLFELIGRRVFAAGFEPESAMAVKLANGFVLACAIEAMSEAFALTARHGVAPELLRDVLTGGLFSAPAYEIYSRIIVDQSYETPGFTARLGLKDMELALEAAARANVPLPSVSVVRDRLLGAIAHGDGECDWAVLAREQARASGLSD
jgi:3-hydroxyisobutyrate dehydrogenase-like beta-hydroxyacid dehydrogenase